jgi:DNA-binding protein HU-beta
LKNSNSGLSKDFKFFCRFFFLCGVELAHCALRNQAQEKIIGDANMNKAELVEKMAKETGLSKKDTEATLKSFVETVSKELEKGHEVQLIGFGTFSVGKRAAREGVNPATGEKIKIPASKSPKFKAGKALKDRVNKK